MVERSIQKVRKQVVKLALSGIDVMFVAEYPEQEVGSGSAFVFGSAKEQPRFDLCARRLLNELKSKIDDIGFELEFTIKRKVENGKK